MVAKAPDLALVAALEKRMFNAWPAVETLILDDWILRWAMGYSKRANSASALAPQTQADDALIAAIEAQFMLWRTRIIFRLSPLAAPDLDKRLADRGYVHIETTDVMTGAVGKAKADPRVVFAETPPAGWLEANAAAYGGDKADHTALREIVRRIRLPAAFATLVEDGRPIAWGIAVVERGYVQLQDIVVDPARRGNGAGRALVESLLAFGDARGARQAHLQMRDTNHVARRLYEGLGFSVAYSYSHRVKDVTV